MNDITTGLAFGKAVCEHFKLPAHKVCHDMHVNADADHVFSLTLTVCLNADDLAAIAKHMGAGEKPRWFAGRAQWVKSFRCDGIGRATKGIAIDCMERFRSWAGR